MRRRQGSRQGIASDKHGGLTKTYNCRSVLGTLVNIRGIDRIFGTLTTPQGWRHTAVELFNSPGGHMMTGGTRGGGGGMNRRVSLSSQRCGSTTRPGIKTHIVSWLPATVPPSPSQTGKLSRRTWKSGAEPHITCTSEEEFQPCVVED